MVNVVENFTPKIHQFSEKKNTTNFHWFWQTAHAAHFPFSSVKNFGRTNIWMEHLQNIMQIIDDEELLPSKQEWPYIQISNELRNIYLKLKRDEDEEQSEQSLYGYGNFVVSLMLASAFLLQTLSFYDSLPQLWI